MLWKSWSFGSAGLVPSCTPADHRWGGYQGGLWPWFWAWVVAAGWSAFQVSSVLTTRMSSSALPPASSHLAATSKGQGQFFCFYALLVGSLEPGPSVHLFCSALVGGAESILPGAAAGERQEQLFCSQGHFSHPPQVSQGWEGGRHLPLLTPPWLL